MTNTKQMEQTRDEKGRITGGVPPNGFNKNPQNRHNGAWKKEDTPRYKLEQMMQFTEQELEIVKNNTDAPKFERNLAKAVLADDWQTVERIINQVYGQPKESHELTNPDGNLTPTVRIIDERPTNT